MSLSWKDLSQLTRSGVVKTVAYGHNQSWFSATRGKNISQFWKVLEAGQSELYKQIPILSQRGLNTAGLEAHLMNLALAREKVIRYEFELDPIRRRLYTEKSAAVAFDAAVKEIASAIERVLPRVLP
jgi:hypothetical protein